MKLLHKYKNGNVNVEIYDDGTKIREWPDGERPQVEYPESCDLKITQYCDMASVCVYCFPSGTIITKADGSKVPIEEIKIGDIVVSSYNGQVNNNPVYNLFERDYEGDLIVFELEDGVVLKCTPNHKIYTERGLVRADEVLEDDKIVQIIYNLHEELQVLQH